MFFTTGPNNTGRDVLKVMRFATGVLCAAVLLTAGCGSSKSNSGTSQSSAAKKNAGNFSSVVFIGDSLTAGFQNGSLLDTQQPHGYAAVLASQAKFNIILPLVAPPGAPAVLQLQSINPLQTTQASGTTTGRDDFSVQPTDLAVPGHNLNDVLNTAPLPTPLSGQDLITQLVLGYPGLGLGYLRSQVQEAIALKPTTIIIWVGNNDALHSVTNGTSTGLTPTADFTTQFTQLMQDLTKQTTANLIVANIPDVTLIPFLTPAQVILAEASAQSGLPQAQIGALLGIQPGDFVTPTGLGEIPAILQNALAGQPTSPIDDAGVLTAAEAQQVQAAVTAYNQVIATQSAAAGATLVDINALFAATAATPPTFNGVQSSTSFLGGIFSLDGIHPTNTGYAVVANKFIDTMNASLKTQIPDADVNAIAAADPLFGPNIKSISGHALPAHITPELGKAAAAALFRK